VQVTTGLANVVAKGAPYRYIPLPATGGAQRFSDTDWIMTKFVLDGVEREKLSDALLGQLVKLNRKLAKEGKAVEDAAEQKTMLDAMVAEYMDKKLPYLKATKAL
jgi:hypothetical protein